jgi:ABC-type uncharacterized transport system substrate-binding protein
MRRSRSNSLRSHASFEHDAKNALFWGLGQPDTIRERAAELAALAPDVILSSGTAALAPLLQATRTVPIVFVNVTDY